MKVQNSLPLTMSNIPDWFSNPEWWSAIGTILASVTAIVIASLNWIKSRFIDKKAKLIVKDISFRLITGNPQAHIFTIITKNDGKLIATNCSFNFVIVNNITGDREVDSRFVDNNLGHIAPDAVTYSHIESIMLDPEPSYTVWIFYNVNGESQKPTKHSLRYRANYLIE